MQQTKINISLSPATVRNLRANSITATTSGMTLSNGYNAPSAYTMIATFCNAYEGKNMADFNNFQQAYC